MNEQVIEFEEPTMVITEKRIVNCTYCQIDTPHWLMRNGNYMCGFCGTEHAV